MWIRVTEELYLPSDDIVGFFGPGVLGGGETGGGDEGSGPGGRADALMRDGAVVAMPFRLKTLASRIARGACEHTTANTGE